LAPESDREQSRRDIPEGNRHDLEERLSAIETTIEDVRRRLVVAELRTAPARLLTGVADVRRIVSQDLDDLAEVLARWDVPLSPTDEQELHRMSLVAQGLSGTGRTTVYLVVDVTAQITASDLERIAAAARILSSRSRRAIPVLVTLSPASHDSTEAALAVGVEIVVDL
jgi:hypothetical protein